MVNIESFLLKTTLKFHVKCQSLGTPFLKGIGVMYCNWRHPLLLECLITICRCIRIIRSASDSIYKAYHGQHHVITTKNNTQIPCQMSEFWLILRIGYGIMCCNERHILLLEYFIIFPTHIRVLGRAYNSIYKAWHGQHHVITTKNNTQISCEISEFGLPLRTGNWMLCYKEGHSFLKTLP